MGWTASLGSARLSRRNPDSTGSSPPENAGAGCTTFSRQVKRAGEQPVFRFNNAMIEHGQQKRSSYSQLQVCINTDNLSVFDTSPGIRVRATVSGAQPYVRGRQIQGVPGSGYLGVSG